MLSTRATLEGCNMLNKDLQVLFIMTVCFLLGGTSITSAEPLSQGQRDSILKGVFHSCIESVPHEINHKFGEISVKRFCSCYSDHLANHMNQKQFEAMIVNPKTGRSQPPPGYQALVADANRACASEMSAR